MKKYFGNILCTLYASIYPFVSNIVQDRFEESGNPYLLLWFRVVSPLLIGILLGLHIKLRNGKIDNSVRWVNLLSVIANVVIVFLLWQKSYVISSYNLILAGVFGLDCFFGWFAGKQNDEI